MIEEPIFPSIPRDQDPDKIPLPGAPSSEQESVFASNPILAQLANELVGFDARPPKEKKTRAYGWARSMVSDPAQFTGVFDALAILKEVNAYPGLQEFVNGVRECLPKAERKSFPPDPKEFEQWLTLYTESGVYKEDAEKILERFLDQCKDTKTLVDCLYALSLAGFRTSNEKVLRKTVDILQYQTNVMPPTSGQAMRTMLMMFDRDDAVLKKAMEIDFGVLFYTNTRFPEMHDQHREHMHFIMDQPEFQKRLIKDIGRDKARYDALVQFYSMPQDNLGVQSVDPTAQNEIMKQFPYNLLFQDIGPLRKWLNEALADELSIRKGKKAVTLDFPYATGVYEGESAATAIYTALHAPNTDDRQMEEARYWRTLAHFIDKRLENDDALELFRNSNQKLIAGMNDSQYLLNPSGDEIEIVDPLLQPMGFKRILFEANRKNGLETLVTLTVGNFQYRALLDEHSALRDHNTRESIVLPSTGVFLQYIILGHLYELRCANRVKESGGGGGAGVEQKARSRRPHRRELPIGTRPTPEQIIHVLEKYHIDLERMNRERAAAAQGKGEKDFQRCTYVSEVESVSGGLPIRSRAPEATALLQKILKPLPQQESIGKEDLDA